MDSIRSPGRLLKLHQESTWSPSGVHLESIRSPPGVHLDLSQGSNHCALPRNPARLQVYSSWTPDGVHQDGDYTRTPDPVLPKPEQDSTHANLINCYCQKTNVSTRIRTQDLCGTNNDACNHSAIWPQRLSNNKE